MLFQLFKVGIEELSFPFIVNIFVGWHGSSFSNDLGHPMFHPFAWYSISHKTENEKYLILVGRIDIFILHEIDDVGELKFF